MPDDYTTYLRSAHWLTMRRVALDRAGHRCQVCGTVERLEVHHNTYDPYHEAIYDLVVLCVECHARYHGKVHQ